uniref:Phosphoenolpyruvate carboxylase n=1 Tax=Solanum tuberosum TaxID=4113 RepID=M1BTN9_SOLTU
MQATPELEYGRMNIGSRPAKRKPSGGIESLRAIPWIFAWTQTRFHLPVWLGFGAAFKHVIEKDIRNLQMLKDMYNGWPFFRVTLDLLEMVFAKGDPGIAALYDKLLVSEDLWPLGERLRSKYEETKGFLLQVHKLILLFYLITRKLTFYGTSLLIALLVIGCRAQGSFGRRSILEAKAQTS